CSGFDTRVCTDGKCGVYEVLCDGIVDCEDGSDENNCSAVATETCANGHVINKQLVCDGGKDCEDESDEQNCCERLQGGKSCSNGNCVSFANICDGKDDCGDGSDELSCPVGVCDNGGVYYMRARCDGMNDCGDNSDEQNCNCYYLRDKGTSYRGRANRYSSCQFWTSQYPHTHNHTPQAYPRAGLERNYCRNPDGKDRPWCYTNNLLIRWRYCDDVFACDGMITLLPLVGFIRNAEVACDGRPGLRRLRFHNHVSRRRAGFVPEEHAVLQPRLRITSGRKTTSELTGYFVDKHTGRQHRLQFDGGRQFLRFSCATSNGGAMEPEAPADLGQTIST
ncbi:sortilin-related receptor-like, partial [Branchiostoma floridae]|uniref:Sortilin-related receptor-like n=1 Tax=Branchiostoma floridae TaxID=7739 RepID=A0A9J7KL97_BRAFL